jgi:very-long-chain (3R)-3-hydroxyacyl-CoA dehydratase
MSKLGIFRPTESSAQVQSSPFFASMVFAWCTAEIIRYPVYALAQLNIKLYPLDWLRYTLFYILYPLGAGSEAYLIYAAIPWARQKYGFPGSTFMTIMVFAWPQGEPKLSVASVRLKSQADANGPPALMVMMNHMHGQRKKFIGRAGASQKKRQ